MPFTLEDIMQKIEEGFYYTAYNGFDARLCITHILRAIQSQTQQ